ncbi:uncharacterized protein BHQ10_003631 [Talaromyces amestolkiae]|uniref:AB hydrolase-1 domain-containing protein n=1 Tax=Talaromyces amestolkiae TaxID=1196081 RepID=A0A364KVR2_TALAM|nr:uncharacterized protein BHQ10_003631 [Talaromyces amestolkiae]RAO67619.1 hypothetical protein BHQ10_003631 [Talaromyces amestolkiae]
MTENPSFIFVPGAWHRAEVWQKVMSELSGQGYTCIAVTLPSTITPSAAFADDVSVVQNTVREETQKGRDVVIVVHSYGGQVGNSAVKGLSRKPASVSSSSGHVIGLALIASGFPATGVSFVDGLGGEIPPEWKVDTDKGLISLAVDPQELMYQDLSENEGKLWVARLTIQSVKAMTEGGESAYAGWKEVPNWFLVTLDDRAYAAQAQRFFIKAAQDAGADVTVREVASSHSPMLSKPKETAEFILDAAKDFVNRIPGF